jgi:hypothetical protein
MVDSPNIAPANRGGLSFDQDLPMPRLGNGKLFNLYGAVSGQHCSHHFPTHRLLRVSLDDKADPFSQIV